MRIRSPKDFWAGLIFVAIGTGFILLALQYRIGDFHRMGPAMFPTLVGALLAALGAIIALRALALDGDIMRPAHAVEVEFDCLTDASLDFFQRVSGTGAAGQVGQVGAVVVTVLVFDDVRFDAGGRTRETAVRPHEHPHQRLAYALGPADLGSTHALVFG